MAWSLKPIRIWPGTTEPETKALLWEEAAFWGLLSKVSAEGTTYIPGWVVGGMAGVGAGAGGGAAGGGVALTSASICGI